MFYSPKKDIQRYVTLKNHQIKSLKEQLQSQKITEQSVQISRKKLQKLKNQYNVLICQNHHQLVETLNKFEDKKKLLTGEISNKQKQFKLKNQEKSDVTEMRRQIMDKIQKAKKRVSTQRDLKSKLTTQRQQLDVSVMKLVTQNQNTRKENQQMQKLVQMAKKQLDQCRAKTNKTQSKSSTFKQQMNEIGSNIVNKKQNLGCLKAQTKIQELKVQNLEIKAQYLMQVKLNLLQQKQKVSNEKLIFKERAELSKHQIVTASIMNNMVTFSAAMKQTKLAQKQSYQREIKEKLIELQLAQCVQSQLRQQIKSLQHKICNTQQNSNEITSRLKGLPIQDFELFSMLIKRNTDTKDRKVNDKKSVHNVLQNKQNLSTAQSDFKQNMWSKINPTDLAKTCEDQSQVYNK